MLILLQRQKGKHYEGKGIFYKTISISKKPNKDANCVEMGLKMLFIWNRKYCINLNGAQQAHNKHMQYDPGKGSCVKQTLLFSENYMEEKGFNLKPPVQFSNDNKHSFSGFYFMYFNFSDLSNHVEAVGILNEDNNSESEVVQNTRGKGKMPITEFIDRAKEAFKEQGDTCKKSFII